MVLPQWNICEQLLSDDITYKTDETWAKMKSGIEKLHELLFPDSIFKFLKEHLRFPTMKVNIIDYANADQYPGALRKLDNYRKGMGIPIPAEKSQILKKLQPMWGNIPNMSDQELQSNIDYVQKILNGARLESKYTGDMAFENQLSKYLLAFTKEKQARLNA